MTNEPRPVEYRITAVQVSEEPGLGPCYRVTQETPDGLVLYVLPRAAIASDMELYGIDDPLTVLDWRLHGSQDPAAPLTPDPDREPASISAALEARTLDAGREYAAFALHAGHVPDEHRARVRRDVDAVTDHVTAAKTTAAQLRAAEIDQVKTRFRVAEDDGLAALRDLVADHAAEIDAARAEYRRDLITSILQHPQPSPPP
ncbi:hypothetical protein GCM10012275_39770 [Longimycelium tulufanense]|uniref:Uncharacterized protein n=1 Tax=Longimycelium tulufanense TaxID=907463 RepID=A0A8J3CAJ9_9PSEU|nr:hypothetical protein [Longimycelium tulufanense]GGM65253.1 hypothetical protein GCM10012275_39770 [Longimycelium tulufanense]